MNSASRRGSQCQPFALAAVWQVGGDFLGGVFEGFEAVGMRGHETQDAFDARGFPARRDVHQHQRREHPVAGLGHQAGQAAHRGAHQHRAGAQGAGREHDIIDELFAAVGQVGGVAPGLAVAAQVPGQAGPARLCQAALGAQPGLARLAKAVGEQQARGNAIGRAGFQTHAAAAREGKRARAGHRDGGGGMNHTAEYGLRFVRLSIPARMVHDRSIP